mgnify:CR=1
MAQAIVDPEELVAFANELEQYIRTIDEETGKLGSAFQHLSESWKDEKQAQFGEKFNELRATMSSFEENAKEQIPVLRAMAEKAAEYLRA